MLWAFFLSSFSSGSALPRDGLGREKSTWEEFAVLASDSPDCVLMPGLVQILGPWFFRARDALSVRVEIKRILADYLFDSPLHHALILF